MDDWEYWTPEEHERLIENMSAWMDGELPDIANTPEAGGPDDLELEVAEHQACCPSCRALFGELKELRAGFEALPEPDPPEGFTQDVMERIREAEPKKVIPLFRRPQFRALAGLAACAVLTLGVYSAVQARKDPGSGDFAMVARSFQQDVAEALTEEAGEEPASVTPDCAPEVLDSNLEVSSAAQAPDSAPETPPAQVRSRTLAALEAPEIAPEASEGPQEAPPIPEEPEASPAPQAASYSGLDSVDSMAGSDTPAEENGLGCVTVGAPPEGGTDEGLEAAPNLTADGLAEDRLSLLELSENTMAMEHFPEGAAELIPPETAAQPYPGGGTVYLDVPKDIYDQIGQLAVEQGVRVACALTGDGGAADGPFTLIILED